MKDSSSGLCPLRLSRHCWYFYYLTVFSFHLSAHFTLTFDVLMLKHLFLSFPKWSDLICDSMILGFAALVSFVFHSFRIRFCCFCLLLLQCERSESAQQLRTALYKNIKKAISLCLVYNNNEHCLSRTDQPRETTRLCLLYELIPKELSKTEPEDTPLLNYLACWPFPLLAILDNSLVII